MKTWLTVLILIFLIQCSYGQDKIFTRNNKELDVKIVNESAKFFNYTTNESDTVSILTIKRTHISRIEYSNGTVNLIGYQNPRKSRPLGFRVGYGNSASETFHHIRVTYTERIITLFSAEVEYFIIPQIEIHVTAYKNQYGWSFFNPGCNLHINSNRNSKGLTPYLGIEGVSAWLEEYGHTNFAQIPVGLNYLSKFGLDISASFNMILRDYLPPYLQFRIGWNFKV